MAKSQKKRLLPLTIACMLICCIWMLSVLRARAISLDSSDYLTETISDTITANGGVLSITGAKAYSAEGTYVLTNSTSGTLRVTIKYSSMVDPTYTYNLFGTRTENGHVKVGGGDVATYELTAATGTLVFVLDPGEAITFTMKSAWAVAAQISIDSIEAIQIVVSTLSFGNGQNGTYSITAPSDYQSMIGTGETVTVESTTDISVTANSPASGYTFYAWCVRTANGVKTVSTQATTTLNMDVSGELYPLYLKSTDAMFWVNGYVYDDWDEAFAAANDTHTVVLDKSGTLPAGTYSMDSGDRLLIPYDSYRTENFGDPTTVIPGTRTATVYRTLTLSNGTVINCVGGQICVNAVQAASSVGTGYVLSQYGHIATVTGSQINLTAGAQLYAYGYISGEGTVSLSGSSADGVKSTLHELLEVPGWRGGNVSNSCVNTVGIDLGFTTIGYDRRINSLCFVNYYVQNVLCNLEVYGTAETVIHGAIEASDSMYTFISPLLSSTDGSLFTLSSDAKVTRKYTTSTDRMTYALESGIITTGKLIITASIGSIDTSSYIFPIDSSITFIVRDGATMNITQKIKLLPGTELIVEEGGTCNVSNCLFVYDYDEWGGYANNTKAKLVSSNLPSQFKEYSRTLSSDALLQVDGTLNITSTSGNVYCSNSGGNITGTGRVVVNTSVSTSQFTVTECNGSETNYKIPMAVVAEVPFFPIRDILCGLSQSTTDLKAMTPGLTYHGIGDGSWYNYTVTLEEPYSDYFTLDPNYMGATGNKTGVIAYICSGGTMPFTVNGYNVSTNAGTVALSAEPTSSTAAYELSGIDKNVTLSLSDPHKTQMVLGASLDMRFALPKAYFTNITSITINGETYSKGRFTAVGNNISDYCYVICSGIAAKDMGKEFTFVIHYADGSSSPAYTESIQSYAERMLSNTEYLEKYPTAKTMFVDMLNYGAAADQYFNGIADSTINDGVADLTGTADKILSDTVGDLSGNTVQAALRLGSTIELLFKFEGVTDAAYARVDFDSHWGENYGQIYRVDNLTMDNDAIVVAVDRLLVADASQPVTVQLYDKDGGVLKTVTGSIQDYLQRIYSTEEDGSALKNLCVEIMRFSKSTYDFLHARYPQPNTGESAG